MTKSKRENGVVWSRVVVGGGWCYHDQLDGLDLQHGDHLLVRWPDGTERERVVAIRKGTRRVMDMGHYCEVSTRVAYVPASVNGIHVEIPLRGLEVAMVKPALTNRVTFDGQAPSVRIVAGSRCVLGNPGACMNCSTAGEHCRIRR